MGTGPPGPAVGLALWGTGTLAETVGHAQHAEAVGFESIWLVDTQLLSRELYVTLSACAQATQRIGLAPGVTVPRTRHASVTAAALASLHELAPGRVMAGMGTGHSALRNIGQQPARIAELARYVETVRALLAGEQVTFGEACTGALGWLDSPVPVPLHVAATGPRLTREAAAFADGVILLHGASRSLVDTAIERVHDGAAAAGRAAGEVPLTVWLYVGLDADIDRARNQVKGRVAAIMRMASPVNFQGEDREAVERVHRAYDLSAHGAALPAHADLVPADFIERYAVAGDAGEVADRIRGFLADSRVARVVVSPQVGGPGDTVTRDFIARFAEVLEGLRS